MKKLSLIILAALALLNFSCTKNDNRLCCGAPDAPFISAKKDNVAWTGRPEMYQITPDTLAITGRQTEQSFLIKIKLTGKGVYPLKGGQSFYMLTVGGDVSVAEYILDDAATNSLEITDYDNNRKMIKGKFSVTLKKVYGNPTAAYPATIKFTEGAFTQYLPK